MAARTFSPLVVSSAIPFGSPQLVARVLSVIVKAFAFIFFWFRKFEHPILPFFSSFLPDSLVSDGHEPIVREYSNFALYEVVVEAKVKRALEVTQVEAHVLAVFEIA